MPDSNEALPEHRIDITPELLNVLKQQAETLKTQERLLRRHERNQESLIRELSSLHDEVSKLSSNHEKYSDALDYFTNATMAPTLDSVWNFLSKTQLSLTSTLERLVNSDDSFARFGDGEFKLMLSPWRNLAFQQNSFELIDSLERTVSSSVDGLLVGLPQFMRNANYLKLWPQIWGHLQTLLSYDTIYANSHVSRPLAFKFLGDNAVELWREVWRGKSLTVITGKGSRFETVPALFDSAASIDRIDSTPTNGFSDIDRIVELTEASDSDIFLVSLGPAGTVLAHDIALSKRRALDIGHLSAAYLNMIEGQAVPEHTPLIR